MNATGVPGVLSTSACAVAIVVVLEGESLSCAAGAQPPDSESCYGSITGW